MTWQSPNDPWLPRTRGAKIAQVPARETAEKEPGVDGGGGKALRL